ncbi:hypothetical protein COR50_11770 [Chitinophaga caeni]|uniref:RNA polymerase sigma-70 factor n=1 Tax=Chitinophaga caeni TaxID=2029983 RepID=A0A291QUZ6_9BACT|nr:sigma-70 family RNA polymerase sigma factor [Chitinophaga caeni]ATL47788.1 hypothetical protein COR50_11770 [Chitinophaga caeni]
MHRIAELQGDNEAVFRDIFNEFHAPLYTFLYQKLSSDYLAKEVVQLTFIKLWRYRRSLDPAVDIAIQIFRIAKTTLIDEIRKIQTRQKYYQVIPIGGSLHGEILPTIYYKETLSKIEQLMHLLPPKRREVFRLSKIYCHTNKEIAAKLSISPKTVEQHITLALRFMKPFFQVLLIIFYIVN